MNQLKLLTTGVVFAGLAAGCAGLAKPSNSDAGHEFSIFLDVSRSTTNQRDYWVSIFKNNVLPAIKPGDRVTLFYIDGSTLENSPVFEREIPPAGKTLREAGLSRAALKAAREEFLQGVLSAPSAERRSCTTDVLGAFARVAESTRGRARTAIFFTDAIHDDTSECGTIRDHARPKNSVGNFERIDLTPAKRLELIGRARKRYGLKDCQL